MCAALGAVKVLFDSPIVGFPKIFRIGNGYGQTIKVAAKG
jgi:hypothetical protein